MKLRLSTKPPFDFVQRWVSRIIWAHWLLSFLFWELTGDMRYTPWRTLSETAWDIENKYPQTDGLLEAFLLGLVVHIRYRDTLESSFEWGKDLEKRFDEFVARTQEKGFA